MRSLSHPNVLGSKTGATRCWRPSNPRETVSAMPPPAKSIADERRSGLAARLPRGASRAGGEAVRSPASARDNPAAPRKNPFGPGPT